MWKCPFQHQFEASSSQIKDEGVNFLKGCWKRLQGGGHIGCLGVRPEIGKIHTCPTYQLWPFSFSPENHPEQQHGVPKMNIREFSGTAVSVEILQSRLSGGATEPSQPDLPPPNPSPRTWFGPDFDPSRTRNGGCGVRTGSKFNQVRGEGLGGGRVQRGRSGWLGSVAPRKVLILQKPWILGI